MFDHRLINQSESRDMTPPNQLMPVGELLAVAKYADNQLLLLLLSLMFDCVEKYSVDIIVVIVMSFMN